MIDLTKAPEGATHYGVSNINGICWYIITDGKYKYIYDRDLGKGEWSDGVHSRPAHDIKPINNWTIYNNTKPLSELTDEQAAELFNHNRHGGALQVKSEPVGWLNIKSPQWHSDCAYRAKQKSERELFIDSALASCDAIKLLKGDNVTLLEAMFKAGFKAPEDKQC